MLSGGFFATAQNPNACTIQPSCTPTQGVCSSPAQNSQLPDGEVGVFYSTVIQFSVAPEFSGIPIGTCTLSFISAPDGLTAVITPAGSSDTTTTVVGGDYACVTIYGTPNAVDLNGIVTIQGTTMLGGVPQSLDFNYNIVINASTAGLEEQGMSALQIAPNPSNGTFHIQVNEPTSLMAVDMLGNTLAEFEVQSEFALDAMTWNKGIYFLIDKANGKSYKIIKQ